MTRAGDKKNERSAFIVSVPALVDQMPSALNGKQIRQLASGGRHIALCTEDGEVYAWGRGVAGCLHNAAKGVVRKAYHTMREPLAVRGGRFAMGNWILKPLCNGINWAVF